MENIKQRSHTDSNQGCLQGGCLVVSLWETHGLVCVKGGQERCRRTLWGSWLWISAGALTSQSAPQQVWSLFNCCTMAARAMPWWHPPKPGPGPSTAQLSSLRHLPALAGCCFEPALSSGSCLESCFSAPVAIILRCNWGSWPRFLKVANGSFGLPCSWPGGDGVGTHGG